MSERIYITKNSWYQIIPSFYKLVEQEYDNLWNMRPIESISIPIMGKMVKIPRQQAVYGNSSYSFSKIVVNPLPMENKNMIEILDKINQYDENYQYNGIFVNWYLDGNEYIGWHSDDENDLVKGAPIYSLSFGATRKFNIKIKKTKELISINLEDGMLLVMGGNMQKECKHSIPKTKKCNKSRINFTVRSFNNV